MISEKEIEKIRYNKASLLSLRKIQDINFELYGSNSAIVYYRQPYIQYEKYLKSFVNQNSKVLDLCVGDGINTIFTAKLGCNIIATDIAVESLNLGQLRANHFKLDNVKFLLEDAENLSFDDNSFDIVTMVGSLSYLDLNKFIQEVKRVLRPGGKLIILDSFNHNIFYKLNRYLHYLKGNRTKNTLLRMPNNETIKILNKNFKNPHIEFFGILIFLIPLFKLFFNDSTIASIILKFDKRLNFLKKYSFKILFIADNN